MWKGEPTAMSPPTSQPSPQGHIAIYARDARWRRAVAKELAQSGHSFSAAASPEELHRLLLMQRFDVLALSVRSEEDAREIAQALDGVRLPHHGILVGNASALPLLVGPRRGGTFRYVPGPLTGRELSRLVDASISAGTWDDGAAEHNTCAQIEEVDLEEVIESAASTVYAQAKRRRQRFSTVVEGPVERALGDPAKIRRVFVALLRLVVTLAPRGAHVSVEARAGKDDWTIRFRASGGQRGADGIALADSLHEETRTLTAVSRDVQSQGGLLWAELMGPAALALCLTLPLPLEAQVSTSA